MTLSGRSRRLLQFKGASRPIPISNLPARSSYSFAIVVPILISIVFGCLDLGSVSSLSERIRPRSNTNFNININTNDVLGDRSRVSRSTSTPIPLVSSVAASHSRRDWLVTAAGSVGAGASGLMWKTAPVQASVDASATSNARPKLGQEYFTNPVASDPGAGRSYFPALTPPFRNRATYRYDLGRGAWALEQLLTLANVTATIRCNVIKLEATGGLWVHSPQWPTGEFCSLLEGIGGPVEHVVLPCNAFEHKAPMKAFLEKYPDARVWIAPGQYGPLGSCGTTLSNSNPRMGYKVDGILGDKNSPPPPWSDEFDIATLYVDLPRNAGPVSEVAFCHRPTKTLITTDAVVYVPKEPSRILSTYFDEDTLGGDPNFWPKSVLQAVFLPLRAVETATVDGSGSDSSSSSSTADVYYPGYEALVDRLVRAPILRAVVDARAPGAVRDWILEQTTTTTSINDRKKWDYDRVITGHFASPIEATPSDVRASFDYLFKDDLSGSNSLPPIACRDWELLDSINQFIAKYNAGEPAVFDFQRGCVAD